MAVVLVRFVAPRAWLQILLIALPLVLAPVALLIREVHFDLDTAKAQPFASSLQFAIAAFMALAAYAAIARIRRRVEAKSAGAAPCAT
jgi:hypothetical protein